MSTHRLRDGSWAECLTPAACDLPFHVALSVAEAEALPLAVLLPLFEAIDPPTEINERDAHCWFDEDRKLHREFDLPAVVEKSGSMRWYLHGVPHRDGDLPCEMGRGTRIWRFHGDPERASGGPSVILHDGTQYWLSGRYDNKFHREGGLPALVRADGYVEFWEKGQRLR